jgi:hypothetical protein
MTKPFARVVSRIGALSATLARLLPSFPTPDAFFLIFPIYPGRRSPSSLFLSFHAASLLHAIFAYLHLHASSYPNLLTLLHIGARVDLLKSLHKAAADWPIPCGDGETKLWRQVRVASLAAFSQAV